MITPFPSSATPALTLNLTTRSPAETRRLGETIGLSVDENEQMTIALLGDLGAGKTVFVQGLARGLGVPADYTITSPTYTLINEYPGRVRLAHADLYRIEEALDAADIGLEEALDRNGVLVVEWAGRLSEGYLKENLAIRISSPEENEAESIRHITLFFYGRPKTNLIDQLKNPFSDN